jgi:hypothetical protein
MPRTGDLSTADSTIHSLKMSDQETTEEPLVTRKTLKPSRKSSAKPTKVASGLGRLLQQQKLELATAATAEEETPQLESELRTPRLGDYKKESFIISPIDASPEESRAPTPSLAPSKPTTSDLHEDGLDDGMFRIDSGVDVDGNLIKTGLEQLTLKSERLGTLSLDRFEPRTVRYSISQDRPRFQVFITFF